ncbi:MAG: DUF418 domain-containing protein [Bacteroidota bacterium]
MTPAGKQTRIYQIDALRGFALFGILMVNIFVFHAPYSHYGAFYGQLEGINKWVLENMVYFFGGKFMFIYAFLFGYSFWLQYARTAEKDQFKTFWNRRMLLLAGFGILHILLLSFGDILLPYALLGLSLPFFAKRSNTSLWILFFLISLIPVYEFILRGIFDYESVFIQPVVSLEEYIAINSQGSWWEIFKLRMQDYFSFGNEKLIIYIPKEMSLFLLGIICARWELATKLSTKKGLAFVIGAGVLIGIMYFFRPDIFLLFDYQESIWQRSLLGLLIHSTEFAHGLFYIIGFFLLWKIPAVRNLLFWLTYPGKLSLTNYLMQSLICAILFSGFGYYGQMTAVALAGTVLAIYLGQLLFSYWWLKTHQYGPMEFIWRKYSRTKNR